MSLLCVQHVFEQIDIEGQVFLIIDYAEMGRTNEPYKLEISGVWNVLGSEEIEQDTWEQNTYH